MLSMKRIIVVFCLLFASVYSDQDPFYLGSTLYAPYMTSPTEPLYSLVMQREFNIAVAENEMKFSGVHGGGQTIYDFSRADAIATLAMQNGMKMRGHTLVWHHAIPSWLSQGNYTSVQLAQILVGHITTVIQHYSQKYPGLILAWDVVNEAYNVEQGYLNEQAALIAAGKDPTDPANIKSPRTIWSKIGQFDAAGNPISTWDPLRDYVRLAFRTARAADPNVKLFYNDYSNEGISTGSTGNYNFVKGLVGEGVPIDGVGMQYHLLLNKPTDVNNYSQSTLLSNLQRYAALGLDIHITELDVRIPTSDATGFIPTTPDLLAAQTQVFANVAATCAQTPACKALLCWGFTYAHSWIPASFAFFGAATPFDQNYVPTPGYLALQKGLLLRKKCCF